MTGYQPIISASAKWESFIYLTQACPEDSLMAQPIVTGCTLNLDPTVENPWIPTTLQDVQ